MFLPAGNVKSRWMSSVRGEGGGGRLDHLGLGAVPDGMFSGTGEDWTLWLCRQGAQLDGGGLGSRRVGGSKM